MVQKAAGENFPSVTNLREMVQKAAGDNFHPVQDIKTLVAETANNFSDPVATATQTASQMYESFVPDRVDKQLSAVRQATIDQLNQTWNSVKTLNERRMLETARKLSKQRKKLQHQLKGYRVMLTRMVEMSSGVPSKQMALMMRRITDCYEAMELLESRAQSAYVDFTGFALTNLSVFQRQKPQRFAKYSSDPILSVATYPLSLHVLLLGGTEIPLRICLHRLGFERCRVGPVTYYFHPGAQNEEASVINTDKTPIVFVHGIGIGLIVYLPLIKDFLKSGRPIYLPEIPYVSGFRPWQSSNAVLQPAVVTSTMVAMLATNGHLSATWVGHSYGTSWLSYMAKYAPETVTALLFLDPICFFIHAPRLAVEFVYAKPDPGSISYMIRTDLTVSRTIQRSFPWTRVALFPEQIHVPCCIVLSSKDMLVPSAEIVSFFKSDYNRVPVVDFETVREKGLVPEKRMLCVVLQGHGHGEWTEQPESYTPIIARTTEELFALAEENPQ